MASDPAPALAGPRAREATPGARPWRAVALVSAALAALLAGLAPPPRGAAASTLLDFVTLDGIDYIRWPDEPGRALVPGDLGAEFAAVACSIGEDPRACAYGQDAAAAFLPAGSRLYAVRGYATEFRLAAVVSGRVLLYQAWRNPRARRGAELYDVAGKVRAVEVRRSLAVAPPTGPATATSPADAEALVAMILRGAPVAPRPHPPGEERYWLTLWLADGTALNRPYFAEASELLGGLALPAEFRAVLDRYAPE